MRVSGATSTTGKWQPDVNREAAGWTWPCFHPAGVQGHSLLHLNQSSPGANRHGRPLTRVQYLDLDGLVTVGDADCHLRGAGVPGRVGQRLLDDAIGGDVDTRR